MKSKAAGGRNGITIVEKFDENDNSLGFFVVDENGNETGPMTLAKAEEMVEQLVKKIESRPATAPRMRMG